MLLWPVLKLMILPMPSISKNKLKRTSLKKNETYFRIVYLWAEGLLDSKQGRVEEGQRKMEDALRIFEMTGCSKSADFYRSAMER